MPTPTDIHVMQSFSNLSGTSGQFSLPVGWYVVDWDTGSDPNIGGTVQVKDAAGNVLCTAAPNGIANLDQGFGPLPGVGCAGFQVGPFSNPLTVVVSAGIIASAIAIQG